MTDLSNGAKLDSFVREMRAVYVHLDNASEQVLAFHKQREGYVPSCGSCKTAGCCYQLTTISLPEGLVLADAVLASPTWRDTVAQLVRVAAEDSKDGLTKTSRMLAIVPCALLDLSDPVRGARCTVYDSRPGCCRFHNAVTPPENCHPSNAGAMIGSLDMLDVEGALWEVTAKLAAALGILPTTQAPISLMTLASMLLLLGARTDRVGEDFEFMANAVANLPSPVTWLEEHALDLFQEEADERERRQPDPGREAHDTKLLQIAKRVFDR